ncbi:MAG: chitosanase [Chloroflexota bacterium]
MSLTATVRNAPDYPAVGEIEIYDGPASGNEVFKWANGAGGLQVLDIKEDPMGDSFNNQPYLWFELQFPGSMTGWVCDEYVMLEGDGSKFGLGRMDEPMSAFSLVHGSANVPTEQNEPRETELADDPTPEGGEPLQFDRVVRVALDITATFEGGYSSYQANPNDKGIISYGRFQFTLAHGALFKVLNEYLKNSSTETATALKSDYLGRVGNKDATLVGDNTFKALLRAAAKEVAMQNAQNKIAKEKYWDIIMELSAGPRGIVTPLGQALMLDMGINHGVYHDYFTLAEQALGVPERSKMPGNGATEQAFFQQVVAKRKERMYRLADKYGWDGLKVRVDFWVDIINAGDWDLNGDASGKVYPKSGREVVVT